MFIELGGCNINIYDKVILDSVYLKIEEGTFLRIHGENGSGKTVLLNTILGMNQHVKGSYHIEYDKDRTAYIPDAPFFLETETVDAAVGILCFFYNKTKEEVYNLLSFLGLNVENIKTDTISSLSKGMRKKLCIVPLFFQGIDFYILDEVFDGLDEETQKRVSERLISLYKKKKTIVIVEHSASIIETLKNKIKMEEYVCEKRIQN